MTNNNNPTHTHYAHKKKTENNSHKSKHAHPKNTPSLKRNKHTTVSKTKKKKEEQLPKTQETHVVVFFSFCSVFESAASLLCIFFCEHFSFQSFLQAHLCPHVLHADFSITLLRNFWRSFFLYFVQSLSANIFPITFYNHFLRINWRCIFVHHFLNRMFQSTYSVTKS